MRLLIKNDSSMLCRGQVSSLGGKPFGLAVAQDGSGLAVTGNVEKNILVIRDGRTVSTKQVAYIPQSFAVSVDNKQVAVGGDVSSHVSSS